MPSSTTTAQNVREHSLCTEVCRQIIHYLSPFWLAVLSILVISFFISGFFAVIIEDRQNALFPFFLLAAWRLPRFERHRMPLAMVVMALLLWLGVKAGRAAINLSASDQVMLSRLEGDNNGLKARSFSQQYNRIAATYRLAALNSIQRSFPDDLEAQAWLKKTGHQSFLIRGQSNFFRLNFPSNMSNYLAAYENVFSEAEVPAHIKDAAQSFELTLGRDLALIKLPASGMFLVVAYLPEAINIPANDPELAAHALVWLARALRANKTDCSTHSGNQWDCARNQSEQEDALVALLKTQGTWAFRGPEALAYYLLASRTLFEFLGGKNENKTLLDSALRRFGKAAEFAPERLNPELFSCSLNNAAVALFAQPDFELSLARANRWLMRAAAKKDSTGKPLLCAKAALLNLYLLDYQIAFSSKLPPPRQKHKRKHKRHKLK